MSDSPNWLVHDHRKYDEALQQCELAAGAGAWREAIAQYQTFLDDLKLHMQMEDDVIYPLLEALGGEAAEEAAALRDEHEALERLLQDLSSIIRTRDYDHFLDSLVPLHEAMRRHNAHEEEAFQRLGNEQALLTQRDAALARLRALEAERGKRVWDF